MARVFGALLAVLYIASSASAVPVESRALGCNVARLKTVAGLRQATTAVNKLANSNDPAAADAAATAQGGLQDASDGIKTIAGAILKGQDPPADARDQVGQGLTAADAALSNVTSTDTATTSLVDDAKAKVQKTISAGQDVLAKCGGGGGDVAAAAGTDANAGTGAAANNGTDASTNNGTDASGASGATDNSSDGSTANNGSSGTDNSSDGSSTSNDNNVDGATGNTGSGTTGNSATGNGSSGSSSSFKGVNTASNLRNSRVFGKRQIGGIGCNVARFQTVGRLGQSSAAVKALKTAAAGDTTAAAAADQATTALNSAKAGIAKIAVALVAGQKAPAAARDQVQKGLDDATTALAGINSTDPNVTSAVTAAQGKVASTLQAGQDVVSKC